MGAARHRISGVPKDIALVGDTQTNAVAHAEFEGSEISHDWLGTENGHET